MNFDFFTHRQIEMSSQPQIQEVAKLEAAKRSLAISQKAVCTALDAAKRRKKTKPAASKPAKRSKKGSKKTSKRK